jgi:hypothetical protein
MFYFEASLSFAIACLQNCLVLCNMEIEKNKRLYMVKEENVRNKEKEHRELIRHIQELDPPINCNSDAELLHQKLTTTQVELNGVLF